MHIEYMHQTECFQTVETCKRKHESKINTAFLSLLATMGKNSEQAHDAQCNVQMSVRVSPISDLKSAQR